MSPTVRRYFEGLPNGFDSYPDALAKGTTLRAMLSEELTRRALEVTEGVPECVQRLVRDPPPPTAWLREVHLIALYSVFYDRTFAQAGGIVAAEDWAYQVNRKLLTGPLYRVMFLAISPERVLRGAGARWSALHRGSELEVLTLAGKRCTMKLAYPRGLMPDHLLRTRGRAIQAATEAAGARDVKIQCHVLSDGEARYELSWS